MGLRRTEPLEAFPDGLPVYSDGYRLIEIVHTHTPLRLYEWQQDLLIRVLERCPPGHAREGQLRYRQVVVSMARQNGKSVIASVLAIYGLTMHSATPRVLGVARNAVQAQIVYDYASDTINASDALRDVLRTRGTAALGISRVDDAGRYVVRASNSEALQGYPSTLAIVDELHVLKSGVFNAIVKSQTAQVNPLIVGITTAGDITSELLKRLYERGAEAVAGADETFGFFVWEGNSDEFTLENITAANPNVIEGIKSAQEIYDDDRHELPADQCRYTLNRFVSGMAEPWVSIQSWAECAGTGLTDFTDCVYAFDITSTGSYATIYAAKLEDNIIKTAVVARLVKPKPDDLKAWAERLRAAGRCTYVMDPNRLRSLTEYLDDKRRNPIRIHPGTKAEAAREVYRAVMDNTIEHDNQPMVNTQQSMAKTKSVNDAFVVVPGNGDADAAFASIYAIYGAIVRKERSIGIA